MTGAILLIIALILIALIIAVLCLWIYRINYYAKYVNFPKPKYPVIIEKDVMVPMKDGTKLATDIYRPKKPKWKFPVIIVRTPYNKSGNLHPYKSLAELFASQGYVVIVQDVRGKYASEGGFYPYAYEALDGYATVTWAGEASWSNGKVAMVGISYLGSCAWLAARYKSPYLCTIIPMFTSQDTYSIWMDNGIPFLKGPLFWLSKYAAKKGDNDGVTHQSIEPSLWKLPVDTLDIPAADKKIPFFRDYLTCLKSEGFWEEISVDKCSAGLDIPVFILGGWYDPFVRGTFEDYQRLIKSKEESKNQYSRIVVGPWAHNPAQKFRAISFGEKAQFSYVMRSILEWCDIWLKENRPIQTEPKVRYFVMGKNEWQESDRWPPEAASEKYYLSLDKKAADLKHGFLSRSPPSQIQKAHYVYNPRNPVLFRGGYLLDSDGWIEPIDQGEIIERDDVLNFISEPLQQDLTIAGYVKLILYVSSQALDTDFCAKICDMHPNGTAYNLAPGFMRMRFRESLEKEVLMKAGEIYRIEIILKPIACTFLKKHRIQLQITSSDFPVHTRNLNTGLNCERSIDIKEAEQTIYTGGEYESYLLLPVLKGT